MGLSCFYHDSAAALLKDGEIVAACQEERLSRKKHDSGFPTKAVKYVLNVRMDDLVLGPYFLDKTEQPEFKEDVDWRTLFEPD